MGKKVMIIFIIAILLLSIFVAQNEHHLEICHDDHCAICNLIHVAQILITLITINVIVMTVGFLIYFFLSQIYKRQIVYTQYSLVFQKVQQNE